MPVLNRQPEASAFSARLSQLLANLCAVLIAAMVLVLAADVTSRNLVGRSITSAAEIAVLIQVHVVFIAAAVAFQRGLHFVIFSVERYPASVAKVLALSVRAVIVVFSAVLGAYGFKLALAQWNQLSASLLIPYSFFYFPLPLGCAITIVFALIEPLNTATGEDPQLASARAAKAIA